MPIEVIASATMPISTTSATTAPLWWKKRRRTIWPWDRPSTSRSSIWFSTAPLCDASFGVLVMRSPGSAGRGLRR
ncbi:Uncharacterised protein [Mycobacteroides abscessus]|nr:Uncharacterised protein [Mycobacteroides abscessus]